MDEFAHLFRLSVPPLELIVRGSAMYWFLFLLFRFVLRRDVGAIAISDVLLLVLIADASQNAMAGSYDSITDGMLLVATIAGWNYAIDWVAYRSALVRRLVEPQPMCLVRDGRPLRANMKRELIGIDELEAKLRQQGVESLDQVKRCYIESDGEISVIRREGGSEPPPPGSKASTLKG